MPSDSALFLLLFFFVAFALLSVGHATIQSEEIKGIGRRALLGLKETPHGSNSTFECSPAGPCVPCLYSEKKDDKYRCSETCYRIPLKCVKMNHIAKETKEKSAQKSHSTMETSHNAAGLHNEDGLGAYVKHRSLLDGSPTLKNAPKVYITFRSCIPPVNEEKLSVLGFEVNMLLLLLVSGSVLYFKRKQAVAMSGFGRIQSNSRF